MRTKTATVVLALAIVLGGTGCGGGTQKPGAPANPNTSNEPAAELVTATGTLKHELKTPGKNHAGGCTVLHLDDGTYWTLGQAPSKYKFESPTYPLYTDEPRMHGVAITDNDGEPLFKVGDRITVTGEIHDGWDPAAEQCPPQVVPKQMVIMANVVPAT